MLVKDAMRMTGAVRHDLQVPVSSPFSSSRYSVFVLVCIIAMLIGETLQVDRFLSAAAPR
jgi:hypothetical protein